MFCKQEMPHEEGGKDEERGGGVKVWGWGGDCM